RGLTTINSGILAINDPLSLGPAAATIPTGTVVNSSLTGSGTLELQFTTLAVGDPNGILKSPALPFNAITNPYVGFTVLKERLTLNGPGFNGLGALYNATGNNDWASGVTLGSLNPLGSDVSIGVAASTNLIVSGVVSDPIQPPPP